LEREGLLHRPHARPGADIENSLWVPQWRGEELVVEGEVQHVVVDVHPIVLSFIVRPPVLGVSKVLECPSVKLAVFKDGRADGGCRRDIGRYD